MKINPMLSTIDTGLSHYWYPLGYSRALLKKSAKPMHFEVLDMPVAL